MKSPIVWFGGKGRMANQILPFMPPHKHYVEVFGGGASLLFAKAPSMTEVYNDVNPGLICFFRTLKDPTAFKKMYQHVLVCPYAREEFFRCYDTWRDLPDGPEKAFRFMVATRMSFGGMNSRSWSSSVLSSNGGVAGHPGVWLGALSRLPAVNRRLANVTIENEDGLTLMPRLDTNDTLFYCDPPYVHSTRIGGGYDFEMHDKDHVALVNMMLTIKGSIVLSGYTNKLYDMLERNGWGVVKWETLCQVDVRKASAGEKMGTRVECLWLNRRAVVSLAKIGVNV